jgi:hypothetical protein
VGAHGVLAQQLVVLDHAAYRLSVTGADGEKVTAPLAVNLACANLQGRKTLDLTIPISLGVPQTFSLSTRCRYVWFSLMLEGSPDQPAQAFRIDRISLAPVAPERASGPESATA